MIVLTVPTDMDPGALTAVLMIAKRFPGLYGLEVRCGERSITLGPGWSYEPSAACLAALGEFGSVQVVNDFGRADTGPCPPADKPGRDEEASNG